MISQQSARVAWWPPWPPRRWARPGLATLGFAATAKKLSANPQGQLKYNVTKLAAKPGR